ncbi:MAG: LysM peptidoglycan-binding domain-containing protein [Verrucomicrobia bacterium]|nr:LysM peptidoglycan-binding domain-containing protein [Verrucomicrobiota bacterium]
MKPFLFLLIAYLAWMPGRLCAQNTAADLALERRANEERFTMLNARVNSLEETRELLLRKNTQLEERLKSLSAEVDRLKDEKAASANRHVTVEDYKKLVEKLREIEQKREEDRNLILERIKDVAKISLPAATHAKTAPPASETDEFYSYTVQSGDTFIAILAGFNAECEKQGLARITPDQVKKANPNLNPNKILVEQVIKIPVPPKK